MASLDGYSLNKKIDDLREEILEELYHMREEFTDIYKYLDEMTKKPKAKKKVAKVSEAIESEE
jgi:hypothetical protein